MTIAQNESGIRAKQKQRGADSQPYPTLTTGEQVGECGPFILSSPSFRYRKTWGLVH